MNKQPEPLNNIEEQLIEHYRQHHDLQPSAAIDACIMQAAASAAASAANKTQQARSNSVFTRLHSWLFGGDRAGRWPVALASVMLIGIAAGLVFKVNAPTSPLYDAPATQQYAAPMSAPAAEPQMQSRKMEKAQIEQTPQVSAVAPASAPPVMTDDARAERRVPKTDRAKKTKTDSVVSVDAQTHAQLLSIIALRKAGDQRGADAALQQLHKRVPELDIEAQLLHLSAHE